MTYNANSIQVLEGLEPVRKRPGMYIGSTNRKGLNHLIYEIVDNSVDEHLAGFCNEIYVALEKDGSATIKDNGRGIPVDMHEKGVAAERIIFTTLHAGGKFDGQSYKVSGGLHGVGSSVVNALAKRLTVTVYKNGVISQDEYSCGKPTMKLEKGLLPQIGKTRKTGTEVNFLPDETIFTETTKFKASAVLQRLKETAYLNPDLTIIFENKRDGEEAVTLHEPNGIAGFVDALTKDAQEEKRVLTEIIRFSSEKDGICVDIAFRYIEEHGENIIGFCNSINTIEGGTHITGFKNTFTKVINNYAKEIGILKEKDPNFQGTDVREGLVAVVAINHREPQFEGQTKTKLNNSDVLSVMGQIVNTEMQIYFDRNLETLKTVIGVAQKASSIRKKEEKGRINLSDKQFNFEGNGKLAKQESNKPEECEIFIVEGDSAGGSAKTARDRHTQAILPIRGKILNVEKQSMDRVLDNAEIKAMIVAFGCGFQHDFDIQKLKYHKIIIMTDADVDGAHISTLLLTFFYRFMPELIYNGNVYRAMPPLYKVEAGTTKKPKDIYLYDDAALEKYKQTHKGTLKIQRYKGLGEMDASQLWETTLDPKTRCLKQIEIEDAVGANEITSILMGSEVEPRKRYIMKHGDEANLDL